MMSKAHWTGHWLQHPRRKETSGGTSRPQTRAAHPLLVASTGVLTIASCVTNRIGGELQGRVAGVSSRQRFPGWQSEHLDC